MSSPELLHRARSTTDSSTVGAPPSSSLLASEPASSGSRMSRPSTPFGSVLLRGHRESDMVGSSFSLSSSNSMKVFLTCSE